MLYNSGSYRAGNFDTSIVSKTEVKAIYPINFTKHYKYSKKDPTSMHVIDNGMNNFKSDACNWTPTCSRVLLLLRLSNTSKTRFYLTKQKLPFKPVLSKVSHASGNCDNIESFMIKAKNLKQI